MKKIILFGQGVLMILLVLSQISWARQTQLEAWNEGQKLNEQVIKLSVEGRYAEAILYAEQALAILEHAMGTKHSSVITARNNLMKLYRMIGDDSKASQLYNQTIKNQENDHRAYARRLNAQGLQLLYSERAMQDPLGTMFFAEPLFKEALSIQEKELDPDDSDIAITLNNLAKINLFDAESLYQRALDIQEKAFGSEHPLVAATLNNFAESYRKLYSGTPLSAYNYAAPLYQRALSIQENVLGSEHPELAETLDSLAALNFEVYLDLTSSLEDQGLDEQIDEKNEKDSDQREAYFFNEALSYYKRSQQIYAQFALQTISFSTEKQQRDFLANITQQLHRFLSLISQNLSQNPDAAKDALDVWLRRKGLALEAQKRFQDVLLNFDDPQAVQVAQEFREVREKLTHLAFIKPDKTKIDPDIYKQQFVELNARKAVLESQLIRLSLPYAISREIANVDTTKVAKVLQEQGGFQLTEQSLANLRNEKNILDELATELQPLVNQKFTDEKEFWDSIEQYIGKERIMRYKSLILKHAQTYPVLLEFARVDMFNYIKRRDFDFEKMYNIEVVWTNEKQWQRQPAHYLVFVLHAGNGEDVTMLDLGNADKIDQKIANFKTFLTGSGRGVDIYTKEPDAKLTELAQELYQSVFAPLKKDLGNVTEIFISPDGNLNLIPFEVLVGPDGRYLIDTYTFNYLATGRDILRFRKSQEKSHASLLMGYPDFDFSLPATSVSPCDASMMTEVASTPLDVEPEEENNRNSADMSSLFPFVREHIKNSKAEVMEIHKEIQKSGEASTYYIGTEAREDVLLCIESPRILHLATHGFFLEDQDIREFIHFENPLLRSGIVLTGANTVSDDNSHSQGIVTAEKILGLKLRGTDMIVLSACETGLGDVQAGEGVYGLRRAFLQAGAKSLVMSLWSVNDPATKDLMIRFYTHLLSGKMNRVQSLRQAALEMKAIKPHPYYWGAFVFLGEP